MSLGLDLSASNAKVSRAFEHVDVLEREMPASVAENGRYAIRFGKIDRQTGWCEVFLVPDQTPKPRFGAIFGDVVHNLRCALNYIVTALADASSVPVAVQHQFPIYDSRQRYEQQVGTSKAVKASGPLGGITHGLTLVEQLQPYLQPDPKADLLWHLSRFSNADKHREIPSDLAIPSGPVQIAYDGTIVEKDQVSQIVNWSPDREYLLCRLRFDPPYARNLRTQGPMRVSLGFRTVPFGREPEHGASITAVRDMSDYVRTIVHLFEQL